VQRRGQRGGGCVEEFWIVYCLRVLVVVVVVNVGEATKQNAREKRTKN